MQQTGRSQGWSLHCSPVALCQTTHICLADHRVSSPEHKVWGIFIHSRLTATQGTYKPGTLLFLPPLFSGFPILWVTPESL